MKRPVEVPIVNERPQFVMWDKARAWAAAELQASSDDPNRLELAKTVLVLYANLTDDLGDLTQMAREQYSNDDPRRREFVEWAKAWASAAHEDYERHAAINEEIEARIDSTQGQAAKERAAARLDEINAEIRQVLKNEVRRLGGDPAL